LRYRTGTPLRNAARHAWRRHALLSIQRSATITLPALPLGRFTLMDNQVDPDRCWRWRSLLMDATTTCRHHAGGRFACYLRPIRITFGYHTVYLIPPRGHSIHACATYASAFWRRSAAVYGVATLLRDGQQKHRTQTLRTRRKNSAAGGSTGAYAQQLRTRRVNPTSPPPYTTNEPAG